MADELELLRAADPVPADGPRLADGPLDARAEEALRRLLHEDPPWRRTRFLRTRRGGRAPRARLVWGLAAGVAVLAVAAGAVLGGPDTRQAVAAPRPLTVHGRPTPVPLKDMVALADAAAAAGEPGLRKGTHAQSWSLGMSDDKPPVVLPEERVVRWRADAGHTELVVATDPRRPGRPVLSDEGDTPHEVADGHVIRRTTYPPMWSDAPPQATPPHTAAALRAYLTELARPRADRGTAPLRTGELLDATAELLDNWTLGARESAALVRLFAVADGLRPAGDVTDRLGRRGHAYVYDDGRVRHMLILEPRTGTVLGMEDTFAVAVPEYGVKAGDVMGYSAWMR